MSARFFFCLLALSILISGNAREFEHPGGMHPKKQIDFVKQQVVRQAQPYLDAYHYLLKKADTLLAAESHALPDFNVPGYYVDAAGHRRSSQSLQTDAFAAYACALAWQLSGHTKYADKAAGLLNSWAAVNKSYSNADGPLVMAYSGTALIMAAELLYHYQGWKTEERSQFFDWAATVYLKACREIRTRKNNWADWGRLGSVLCASLLENPDEMNENIRLLKSDLFHKIADDGHMPEETRRGANGIWYTYFSLAPITAACYVVRNCTGEDIFRLEEDGKSIRKALDYLLYYSRHPAEWKWFENPRPGSPSGWPGYLFEAMGAVYGEAAYHNFVSASRPLMVEGHHFAWTFPTLMPAFMHFGR